MNKKAKLIISIIATTLYGTAAVSFFFDFIYVWIVGIGKAGSYKGYEVALNFDGMPTNLGTLFPMLVVFGTFIYGIIAVIKNIKYLKKEPKKQKKSHPLLCAIFFALFPLITFFCALSTSAMLNLPTPKRYGGYYMGIAVYLVAYCTIVGGLMFFLTESGIFTQKDNPVVEKAAPAPKVEAKPAPIPVAKPTPQAVRTPQPARPAQPQAQARPQTAQVRPAQPQVAKPAPQQARPAQPQARPVQPASRPVAPQKAPVKK